MKKRIIFALLLLASLPALEAQSFLWHHAAGSRHDVIGYQMSDGDIYSESVRGICTDSRNNAYFGLLVNGTDSVMIGDTLVRLPDLGATECIGSAIACYDCEGRQAWYKVFYDKNSAAHGSSISYAVMTSSCLMNDSVLLVALRGRAGDTLLVCNDAGEVTRLPHGTAAKLLWINTRTRAIVRQRDCDGMDRMEVEDGRIYCTYNRTSVSSPGQYVDVYNPVGQLLSHTRLDVMSSYYHQHDLATREAELAGLAMRQYDFLAYHGKYYCLLVCNYTTVILGGDTLCDGHSSSEHATTNYVACFDSTGACLWYRPWLDGFHGYNGLAAPHGRNIGICKETGTLYVAETVVGDEVVMGDSLSCRGLAFGAYDTLGNGLFEKHTTGNGYVEVMGLNVLPGNRVALCGAWYGRHTIDNQDNDSVCGIYMLIYDGATGRFFMETTIPSAGPFFSTLTAVHMDSEGSLLFGGMTFGPIASTVFGTDTLRGRSNGYNSLFGKYGWPCGTPADWPDPAGIAPVEGLSPQLTLFPNPAWNDMTLQLDAAGRYRVAVYDDLGRRLLERTFAGERLRLDLSSLATGHYLLKVQSAQGVTVRSFIKR